MRAHEALLELVVAQRGTLADAGKELDAALRLAMKDWKKVSVDTTLL